MVDQRSTRLATHNPLDKRLGLVQHKRKQMNLRIIIFVFIILPLVVLFSTKLPDFSSKAVAALNELPVSAQPIQKDTAPSDPEVDLSAIGILPVEANMEDETQEAAEEIPELQETLEPQVLANIPTQAALLQQEENAQILYYAQSGDSIGVLAIRFGVEAQEITSTAALPEEGFIPVGQLLLIPNRLNQTSSNLKLFPDSEVVNSPSSVDFDIAAYVDQAGGYLSTYKEQVYAHGEMSGAAIVEKVSKEFAIHPRLLLALIEHQTGWVYGPKPADEFSQWYPLGIKMDAAGLHHQLVQAAGLIESGYYGWREGTLVTTDFQDGWRLRLAAELNCGTVGLMQFFSTLYRFEVWSNTLYGEDGFIATYSRMFGDPWVIAQEHEPIFTPDVLQPELILPFEPGIVWAYTVGPHAAWGAADVRAALDFSPPTAESGCHTNWNWVTAAAAGLVVRSEEGVVVVDMDGDGYEQTGWNIIYLHIATTNRVPVGTWLEAGDRIGHPSCEGGKSTGTHLHIARKYNGEWVPAEGPLAFVMSGWKTKSGSEFLQGWLVKGEEVRQASIYGIVASHISR